MSGGLYSTEGRDFDQTLDLKKIKPYGDTMNDGKTQLSFTLPVPAGDEAIEAAKQLMKKMGFENPQVVFHRELTAGYTFFNCYGSCTHTVDYSNIHVPKVESTKWDMAETDSFIREQIGRPIVVIGASTGTDVNFTDTSGYVSILCNCISKMISHHCKWCLSVFLFMACKEISHDFISINTIIVICVDHGKWFIDKWFCT